MKYTFLLLFLAFLSFSCEEEEVTPTGLETGTYVGTFTRSSPNANSPIANVTLVLTDGSFSGSSDQNKYPAIGQGTYRVNGQEITFKDESFWTAEFDWTLILNGTFAVSTNPEAEIILTRQQGTLTDVYCLQKSTGTR